MTDNDLNQSLNKLTEEINAIDENDIESREMLKSLVHAIESKLNTPKDEQGDEQLIGNLRQKALQFETTHPIIGRTLEEIIAILVRLGI